MAFTDNLPLPLFRAQKAPVLVFAVGKVNEQPVADKTNCDSENAFYDKDPKPAVESSKAGHLHDLLLLT